MLMQQWEATKSNSWIDGIVQSLASTLPADQGSIFSDFSTKGYAGAVDLKLISGHGQEILYSDFTNLFLNTTKADMMVKSYLIEKGAYIDKCMQYIEAEYNPVENYAGHEEETITFNGGARHKETEFNKGQQQDTNQIGQKQNTLVKGATQLTDEYGATSDTHIKGATQLTDQYAAVSDTHVKGATQLTDQYGQAVTTTVNGQNGYDETHHIAKTSTQKNPSSLTRTEKSAPFDSDTFYNEKQYSETYGAATETVERVAVGGDGGDDKISYSQKTDQITAAQHTDTHSTLEATDTDTRAARSDIHSTTSVTDTDSSLVHTDTHSTIQVTDTSTDASHTDTLTAGTRKDTGSEDSDGYEDTTERVLDRAGNLGVMTAAEMMQKDYTFWKSFRWLSDMALDIVKLTCEGVICI